jgi:hypothetical protein
MIEKRVDPVDPDPDSDPDTVRNTVVYKFGKKNKL